MKRVVVHNSKIHGKGLFTVDPIVAGESIMAVYTIDSTTKKPVLNSAAKFINHSDSPNSIPKLKNGVQLSAIKKIGKDEEITVDYGQWNSLLPIQYRTKDFRHNKSERDAIVAELANVIVSKKQEVAKVLSSAAILPVGGYVNEQIADVIVDNLHNEKVNNGIMQLLNAQVFQYSNIEPISLTLALIGLASTAVGGTTSIIKMKQAQKLQSQQSKDQIKQQLHQQILMQQKNIQKKKDEATMWLIGTGAFVVVVGGISTAIYLKNQKAQTVVASQPIQSIN